MMKKITYDVGLSNRDCLFDYAEGFETPEDALDWAERRGGKYVIQIGDSRGNDLSISAIYTSRGMRYSRYMPGGWCRMTREEILDWLR